MRKYEVLFRVCGSPHLYVERIETDTDPYRKTSPTERDIEEMAKAKLSNENPLLKLGAIRTVLVRELSKEAG